MKEFRTGEKVKFLSDTGSGVVLRTEPKGIVIVLTDDGFEFPVDSSELIKTEIFDSSGNLKHGKPEKVQMEQPAQNMVIDEPESPTEAEFINMRPSLRISSEMVEDGSDPELLISVTNPGPFRVFVTVGFNGKKGSRNIGEQLLHPKGRKEFRSLPGKRIKEGSETIFLQAVALSEVSHTYCDPATFYITWRMLKEGTDLLWPDGNEEIRKLLEKEPQVKIADKPVKPKEEKKKQGTEPLFPGVEEIDLHINAIMDNYKHLSNGEIVDIQLSRFRTAMEGAIKAKQNKIVFIHGVGEGTLKYRLRRTIDTDFRNCSYQDASFTNYGFGATLVIIRN